MVAHAQSGDELFKTHQLVLGTAWFSDKDEQAFQLGWQRTDGSMAWGTVTGYGLVADYAPEQQQWGFRSQAWLSWVFALGVEFRYMALNNEEQPHYWAFSPLVGVNLPMFYLHKYDNLQFFYGYSLGEIGNKSPHHWQIRYLFSILRKRK